MTVRCGSCGRPVYIGYSSYICPRCGRRPACRGPEHELAEDFPWMDVFRFYEEYFFFRG